MKTDSNQHIQWIRTINGTGDNWGLQVSPTSRGAFFVACTIRDQVDVNPSSTIDLRG